MLLPKSPRNLKAKVKAWVYYMPFCFIERAILEKM